MTILTNGSAVADDGYASQTVFGAVTVNTIAGGAGVIWDLPVTGTGSGYASPPTVTISGGGGTGANATASVNTTAGTLTSLALGNLGAAYTSAPTVTLAGGGVNPVATAATGTAVVNTSLGLVSSITIGGPNNSYASPPTVTFTNTGTGGSGAAATAVISGGVVTNFIITNAGSGYTSTPTVTITGGGALATQGTVGTSIGAGGNVTLTADIGPSGLINTSYGQFNVVGNIVSLAETQNLNIGNTTSRTLTVNSTAANITFTGTSTTQTLSGNANAASIVQVGPLNVSGTSSLRSNNSGGTVLENSSNVFGGAVTITNGGNNIIVSGSPFTLASGTSVTGGNLTVCTTDAFNNQISVAGGNATAVTLNSAGDIRFTANNTAFRNLTLVAANNITQSNALIVNNTLTLTSGANVTLGNTSNNLTTVVLNGTVGDTQVSNSRGLTISGNSTGIVTAEAGIGSSNVTFANPWNLVLGNMNVAGLNARARNGVNNSSFVANGNSGTITQVAGSKLHVENGATFWTWNGDIIVANNGNSFGALNIDTLSQTGSTANVTFVEDATARVSWILNGGNASITSRFGSVIEDAVAPVTVTVNGTTSVLSLNAPNGSISLGGLTNNNTTSGNVVKAAISALGSAAVRSSGNITLGAAAANSLTVVSGNHITQDAPLKIFALASFNATNSITLTNAENNFGPLSLTTQSPNQSIAVTEGSTLNLRTVTYPGSGNGTFTATSVSGDIIDTGLQQVRPVGVAGGPGSGIITLAATNGNIVLDDPTTDLLTTAGVVFSAKNVTLSILGSVGGNLVLGASGTPSTASGNLIASSALGNIGNAGAMTVGGNAFFQTGNGNITIAQPGVGFGSLKFIGNQVNIAESGNMDILTGSTAFGTASLISGGAISIVNSGGGVVTFGNTVAMQAAGNITLSSTQAVGTLAVTATGTKDLSALSLSADLNNRTPVYGGTGPDGSTVPALAPKP
jgi:hypothetical protein